MPTTPHPRSTTEGTKKTGISFFLVVLLLSLGNTLPIMAREAEPRSNKRREENTRISNETSSLNLDGVGLVPEMYPAVAYPFKVTDRLLPKIEDQSNDFETLITSGDLKWFKRLEADVVTGKLSAEYAVQHMGDLISDLNTRISQGRVNVPLRKTAVYLIEHLPEQLASCPPLVVRNYLELRESLLQSLKALKWYTPPAALEFASFMRKELADPRHHDIDQKIMYWQKVGVRTEKFLDLEPRVKALLKSLPFCFDVLRFGSKYDFHIRVDPMGSQVERNFTVKSVSIEIADHHAMTRGNYDVHLKEVLQSPYSTLLIIAEFYSLIASGRLDLLSIFLNKVDGEFLKSIINLPDLNGYTPIGWAILKNADSKVLQKLETYGADLYATQVSSAGYLLPVGCPLQLLFAFNHPYVLTVLQDPQHLRFLQARLRRDPDILPRIVAGVVQRKPQVSHEIYIPAYLLKGLDIGRLTRVPVVDESLISIVWRFLNGINNFFQDPRMPLSILSGSVVFALGNLCLQRFTRRETAPDFKSAINSLLVIMLKREIELPELVPADDGEENRIVAKFRNREEHNRCLLFLEKAKSELPPDSRFGVGFSAYRKNSILFELQIDFDETDVVNFHEKLHEIVAIIDVATSEPRRQHQRNRLNIGSTRSELPALSGAGDEAVRVMQEEGFEAANKQVVYSALLGWLNARRSNKFALQQEKDAAMYVLRHENMASIAKQKATIVDAIQTLYDAANDKTRSYISAVLTNKKRFEDVLFEIKTGKAVVRQDNTEEGKVFLWSAWASIESPGAHSISELLEAKKAVHIILGAVENKSKLDTTQAVRKVEKVESEAAAGKEADEAERAAKRFDELLAKTKSLQAQAQADYKQSAKTYEKTLKESEDPILARLAALWEQRPRCDDVADLRASFFQAVLYLLSQFFKGLQTLRIPDLDHFCHLFYQVKQFDFLTPEGQEKLETLLGILLVQHKEEFVSSLCDLDIQSNLVRLCFPEVMIDPFSAAGPSVKNQYQEADAVFMRHIYCFDLNAKTAPTSGPELLNWGAAAWAVSVMQDLNRQVKARAVTDGAYAEMPKLASLPDSVMDIPLELKSLAERFGLRFETQPDGASDTVAIEARTPFFDGGFGICGNDAGGFQPGSA